ncbi:hypothetical protein [Levilactobacillus fujinensis]|uniref:Uncharacterized protein n=1 Tax=Levilactobacillus fujinensis TaxID=2486024 RepID=A0ABW1TG69_9LACO|nr:hypothetical protein [Levilactobacillus fujinensis]
MNNDTQFHLMDIVVAAVPYDDGKTFKTRPALLVMIDRQQSTVYKITSKYENKSEDIKRFYYPIKFWREAGLDKMSYVDVHTAYALATEYMLQNSPIGKFSKPDQIELFKFVKRVRNNQD